MSPAQTSGKAFWLRKNTVPNQPKWERVTRGSFIYFVATPDRSMVKIGWTVDPTNRLSGLLGSSPVPLEMLAAVPGDRYEEYALHRRYLLRHSHYEWFHSTPEMLADIEAIARSGELPPDICGAKDSRNPLHNSGIRGTKEWRAKMSAIHKERWAKEKSQRTAAAPQSTVPA